MAKCWTNEMASQRLKYPAGHWLRGEDASAVLERYLDQQSKVYSRIKNRFIGELLGELAGKRLLDFGCGGGLWAVQAALEGAAEVIGVDAEAGILAAAELLAARRGAGSCLRFLHRESLPSPDELGCFDVVLVKDILEHLVEDQRLLASARKLMAPGGCLVISTQNAWSLNFLVEGGYHRWLRRDPNWCGWDPTHLRFYSPRILRRLLKAAGFRCQSWRGAYLVPYKLPAPSWSAREFWRVDPLSLVDRYLGRIPPFNQLGWSIMLRAAATDYEPACA
jgi:2-polyprenyl-6-hydroxyphenyl methylase/3-demethylubiquinone-9 3-methyltransferase